MHSILRMVHPSVDSSQPLVSILGNGAGKGKATVDPMFSASISHHSYTGVRKQTPFNLIKTI